jgi:catechol 2,3-dioxygenase-like lactoylglutathione lyase family enzyme
MTGPEPRISIVTLGVDDMRRARAFYERLGWSAAASSNDNVTFFNMGGMIFGLYGRQALAEDAQVEFSSSSFAGVSLAHNCESEERVDAVMEFAEAAGAKVVKQPEKVFWGGYSGYFSDPDGHLWEIAHNPFFPLDEDGRISAP